jgi:DNA-binding NarL/FixJ family response regulator
MPPALVYSVYDDYAHVNAALRSGARGYVCKSQSAEELLTAMEDVASGKAAYPADLLQRLAITSNMMMGLTKREQEIFSMVQRGHDNKEIAAALGVSVRTVENGLSVIYDKTGTKNRRELERL